MLPSSSFADIIRNFQEVSLVKQLVQSPWRWKLNFKLHTEIWFSYTIVKIKICFQHSENRAQYTDISCSYFILFYLILFYLWLKMRKPSTMSTNTSSLSLSAAGFGLRPRSLRNDSGLLRQESMWLIIVSIWRASSTSITKQIKNRLMVSAHKGAHVIKINLTFCMLTVILLESTAVHRYHRVLLEKKSVMVRCLCNTFKPSVWVEGGFTVHLKIRVLCDDAAVGYLLVETLRQSRFPPIGDPKRQECTLMTCHDD